MITSDVCKEMIRSVTACLSADRDSTNGWRFWKYKNSEGKWVALRSLDASTTLSTGKLGTGTSMVRPFDMLTVNKLTTGKLSAGKLTKTAG